MSNSRLSVCIANSAGLTICSQIPVLTQGIPQKSKIDHLKSVPMINTGGYERRPTLAEADTVCEVPCLPGEAEREMYAHHRTPLEQDPSRP